jgi:hypothetical protein
MSTNTITIEGLEGKLANLAQQKEEAIARVNAVHGAMEAIKQLIGELKGEAPAAPEGPVPQFDAVPDPKEIP